MRKTITLGLAILLATAYLTGCEANREDIKEDSLVQQRSEVTPETVVTPQTAVKPVSDVEEKSAVKSLYGDLYIGEACKSGFVYIEPFSIERTSNQGEIIYESYPDSIDFYSLENENYIYNSKFDSKSSVYIPTVEEDSKYFWKGFDSPKQYVLRYKASDKIKETSVGIALFNHQILKIDFGSKGEKRVYSESEYRNALEEVKKDNENKESFGGALREITIEDTIVGAKQICLLSIKGLNYKVLLSKYFSVGFESTVDVYVIDLINNEGKVIDTYKKYNNVAY